MAAKPRSKKKSVSARRSVDDGDKDKLIIEQKNRIAVLENELRLKQDLSSQDVEREWAEDALRINEKFLNNVFNCIQDGVSVLSKDLSIIRYNPTIEKWHGKDLTGKKCYRLFHGREEPCETCPSIRAMREKTMQREVVRDLIGWKELYAYPLVNDEGEVTGTIEQVRDITERKKAEETLRENNRFINTLMGNLPGMVYRRRNAKDWTMEYISSGCSKLTGYKIEDLFLDKKISYGQLIHPEDRERVWDETQQAIHANKPYTLTYRIIAAGQEEKWVWDQGRGMIKNNKMLLEGFITDITVSKRAEEKIAHLASFPELNPNPIFEVGTDGSVKYANPATDRLFPDLIALGTVHPLLNRFKDLVGEFEKGGPALVRDIKYNDVFYQQTIYYVPETGIVRFYNLDITERKQAEAALRESEANLARAQRIAHIGNWSWDTQNDRVQCSDEFYRIFGMERRDFLTYDHFINMLNPEDRDSVHKAVDAALHKGEHYGIDYRVVWPDGTVRIVHAEAEVILDESGTPVRMFGTVQDVTERKQAEETLRKSMAVLARAQEIAHLGSWSLDFDTGKFEASDEEYRIHGFEPQSVVFLDHVWPLIHPDDLKRYREYVESVQQEGRLGGIDYRIVWRDGSLHYVHVTTDSVVRGPDGRVKTASGITLDITERKRAEEALNEAKQLAELYLDLMGHDIRNMNMIGMGFLELALGSPDIKKEDKELLLKSFGSLENSTRLIDNVRKLQKARSVEQTRHDVDACKMIMRVLAHYSNMPGIRASFNYELPSSCMVNADDLLYEVFENIVGNAIKHGGPEPAIDIRFETVDQDGRVYNRFTVEDNGPGIPDVVKDRIFNRLQRGDSKVKGTGLGLYLVRSLVESYGGRVQVEDRVPGDHTKGARFVVMLPAAE